MFDCANVEMRELLPELAAGRLDAATRMRADAHVATCAECASELEMLRLVRAALGTPPRVDTARIVAALPKAPAAARAARAEGTLIRRWGDWRIAAALTMITVGGLSVAVTHRMRGTPAARDGRPAVALDTSERTLARLADTGRGADRVRAASPQMPNAGRTPELSFGGGVGDLDAASIEALMGALDEIDRAPVAPPAEPDRTPLLPVIGESSQ